MRKYAFFYACAGVLLALHFAEGTFQRWSDARSRARSIPLRKPLEEIPFAIGNWLGRSVDLEAEIAQASNADQYIRRDYCGPTGRTIAVYLTYYGGLHRTIPHGPATCYPMGGWKMTQSQTVFDKKGSLGHHAFLFEKELDRHAVVYWYYVNGVRLAGTSWTRFRFASGILRGSGGSIVQVQLATSAAANEAQALEALEQFRLELEAVLSEHLPHPDT